ncbi:MAG: diacylglycerol kinase family lipid kinase [Bacteroidia bacterium]|nr:diacylglycerol kinase family lipid kinase [Bacteroidia bacterium]
MAAWTLIVNPIAGGGKAARLSPKLARLMDQAGIDHAIFQTEGPGHAAELARQAVDNGARRLLSVGGDGTAHEVAAGVLQRTLESGLEVGLATLPAGTAGDWAKMFGLPRTPEALVPLLHQPRFAIQDAGRMLHRTEAGETARFFINVAGMGFDGFVVEQTRHQSKAGLRGQIFYLLGLVQCVSRYKAQQVQVRAEGFEWEGRPTIINAGVCRYSGNGMQLVPRAIANDGLLDMTVVEDLGPLGILSNVYRLYNGSLYEHPKAHHRRTRWIEVSAAGGVATELDGEWIGYINTRFETVPGGLRVLDAQASAPV